MNLDDLTTVWRSQDLSPLYGVNEAVLHQLLRQEQATIAKRDRRMRWFLHVANAILLISAGLFLAILIDPNQPPMFKARLVVWDYVVAAIGLASAFVLAGVLLALRRSRRTREQGFGDSVRDHLRRRIAQLDAEANGDHRLGVTAAISALMCAKAVSILAARIKHVPVPWSEIVRPSPVAFVLTLGFLYVLFFRWVPRERRDNVSRKRELGALLAEMDDH